MSVRAYIRNEIPIYITKQDEVFRDNDIDYYNLYEKKIYFKGNNIDPINAEKYSKFDYEYCYNCWHNPNITELLFNSGAYDFRNDDGIGQIEIHEDNFDELYRNIRNSYQRDTAEYDAIKRIKEYFDKGNIMLTLECF